ncbi:hypothetical protein BaRGS_00002506 [Batillaria attramentaria]|uniref:Protein sidekick n=1 Tax=Batillaria attramentaria TaxID=370345 RepID=A0ABD0M4U4_9CAEN
MRGRSSATVGRAPCLVLFVLAHLSLIAAQGMTEYPPEILEHPAAGQVEIEGSAKRLTCSANAIPSPVYSWFHNGQLKGQNSSTGVLRLQNLRQSDSGEYRCLASNKLGSELSQAADVKVAALRPFIQTGPREVSVDQGQAIVLPLPTIDTLALDLSWEQDNVTLPEIDIFHRITMNSSLVLLSVDKNQNGKEYRVKVEYFVTGFESLSSPYILRVRDASNPTNIPPEVVVAPVDTFAKGGDEVVELECIINARPIRYLTINWYKQNDDGTRARIEQNSNKYLFTTYQRRLLIKEVVESDSGRYICEGVLNVPGMTEPFDPATAAANLTVQAQGVPQPTLHWYFNGRDITTMNSDRHTIQPNGTLEIRNLDLPDAGKYQCFARNAAGEAYQSVWLKVSSAPPQIVKLPEDLTIVELSDARFFCEVTGAPSPQITWTEVVSGSEQPVVIGGRFQVFPDNLLIANVQKSDSGVYKCTATNIKGTQSAQAQLVVITKTQIIRPPQNQTVILSTVVRFECGISRDDNTVPVWEWFFYKNGDMANEKQLASTGRYQITSDGTLLISGVSAQDIGLYKCHVISAGGNDSRIASLKVIELPRPPTIMSVVLNNNENRSVIVTWTKAFDGNSPLLKYIITYRQENPNGNNDGVMWEVYPDDVTPTATSHVVSNLQPSRYYRFRISAVNTVGEGNASQPMPNPAIKMPAQPPSAPPRNFFCTQGLEKQIVTTWDPPVESTLNGDLLGYVLRYKVANLPDSTLQEKLLPGPDRRSYIIQFLVSFKQYAVSIAAYNEEGTGVFSNPFYVWTPQGRPTDSPKNVVAEATNSTAVRLQWDPPNAGEINGNNLGYTIEIHQDSTLVRSFFLGSDPNNLEGRQETMITDLLKFTSYNITLACRTGPGLGPFSIPVTVQTQEDVPGSVHDLSFENIRDRSLTVRWSQPTEINGILLGYILDYEKKNQPDTRESFDLPAELTYYTVQDLVPITNYTIYVAAKTAKGTGEWVSADIQSGVPPKLPGPPHNLGISDIQDRTVLLQFFPGFDGKTSITNWIVLAKAAGQQNYSEIYSISDPTARDILVQNLKPYTRYQLRLIAENIVGRSSPSEPTREFQTLQAPPGSPPGNVTVRALNSTALRISWTPIPSQEWNGAPRGYKIDYRIWSTETEDDGLPSVQEATWTTVQLENGINIDSYILPRLQEWMDYEIRMISYNDVGISPYSPVTSARTRESTPSASPSNLKAKSISSTQIMVTWSPVPRLEQNGQILGYKVLYKPQHHSDSPMFEDVEGKDATNVTLAGLLKYVVYEIQILAYTRMGDGILSTKGIVRTDEDVPGPPIIIYFPNVTYTSAVVVWNPPQEPNGIITGYKVAYRKESSSTPGPEVELGPNIREYMVDRLERETIYLFFVTAKTQLGWGETASVKVLTMVDRDRPEQPTQPTIGSLQVSARNITIAWRPGRDNYGPIRNYTVEYRMRDGPWTTFPESIPPSSTSYTITGLRPNSWYQFRVAATNDIGTSDFSLPSAEVPTLSDKPDGAPQNLRVVAVTRTSIRASWEPPVYSTWNSEVIDGYRLCFMVEKSQQWFYVHVDSGFEKVVSKGLIPRNTYVFMRPAEDTWNGLLLSYVVQYRQIQQRDFQEEIVQFGTETVLLSNLVISQTYEVQVLAVNAKGRGPPSTPATIYVGEAGKLIA